MFFCSLKTHARQRCARLRPVFSSLAIDQWAFSMPRSDWSKQRRQQYFVYVSENCCRWTLGTCWCLLISVSLFLHCSGGIPATPPASVGVRVAPPWRRLTKFGQGRPTQPRAPVATGPVRRGLGSVTMPGQGPEREVNWADRLLNGTAVRTVRRRSSGQIWYRRPTAGECVFSEQTSPLSPLSGCLYRDVIWAIESIPG